MTEDIFTLTTEFITLGQLLKAIGEIDRGSDVKEYLADTVILVNEEPDNRRGRKLRPGDLVVLPSGTRVRLEG
jgi:ribosome-associated protein